MINMHDEARTFGVFEGAIGQWRLAFDTSQDGGFEIVTSNEGKPVEDSIIEVNPRSVVVVVR